MSEKIVLEITATQESSGWISPDEIAELCTTSRITSQPMITRYNATQRRPSHVPSYGQGPVGYDFQINAEDARTKYPSLVRGEDSDVILIPRRTTLTDLESWESFKMPDDVMGVITGKSGYTIRGVVLNATIIEPGWPVGGALPIRFSISNHSDEEVTLHLFGGVGQIVFYRVPGARPYEG